MKPDRPLVFVPIKLPAWHAEFARIRQEQIDAIIRPYAEAARKRIKGA